MKRDELEKIINEAFENKQQVSENSDKKILDAISETIELTDKGNLRVAEKKNGVWSVNQWVKKAILLSFRTNKMTMSKGPYTTWYDKVPGKTVKWKEKDWKKAGYRHVPNGVVRRGSFIAKNAEVLMTREELWQHNYQKSQTFMREHKKRPGRTQEGEEALGKWLNKQITDYNNKTLREDRRAQIKELQREFPLLINVKL